MMQGGMTGYSALNQGQGNQGGISQPYGGSNGMDANRALQILNPAGVGGNGGLGKSGIEAFLDPAGIDSGPMGLNLFGQRQNPNSTNTAFPNLGAASLIPQMPGGSFQPIHNGAGIYNNMAAIGAGGRTFNPSSNPSIGNKPSQTSPGSTHGLPSMPMAVHSNPNLRKR